MGERMGSRRRRERQGSGFVEDDPRLGKRTKRGGRRSSSSSWASQRSKLSGFEGRRGSSSKPYGCEPVWEWDADYLGFLKSRMPAFRRGKKTVDEEENEAGEFAANGGKASAKRTEHRRRSSKLKKNACAAGLPGDGHGNAAEESLGEDNALGESFGGRYEMFMEHSTEKRNSDMLNGCMGDGKRTSFSYEALDRGTRKGYAKREGREGNGDLSREKGRGGGVCIRSKFLVSRMKSPVIGRKTISKYTDGLSCGKMSSRKNQRFQSKTSGANSSLGNDNVAGESLDDDTPGANDVTVDEPLDGEYEMFLGHLTVQETSYMLNATTRDGKLTSFLYEAEDCSTKGGFAEGEGNDELQPKKRRRVEVCIRSKFSLSRQKNHVVGRETSDKTKDDSSSRMTLKNCQSKLSTSGANSSLGIRVSDANNATLDEPLDGEYKMFFDQLKVHETSYMIDVTRGDGKRTYFVYEAADEDLQCRERKDAGICIRSKFGVDRESPLVEREKTTNKTKDGSSGGMGNPLKMIDSTRPTTEAEITVTKVNKARLMELPNSDVALRTKKERGMEAYRDLSQQGKEQKGRSDNERSEAMIWPISHKHPADKEPGIKDLDSTKQRCAEEIGGCDDQVDKGLNSRMENLIADEKVIKEEEVDPTSSSDSDDVVIELDPAMFSHGDSNPFLRADHPELIVVRYDEEEKEEDLAATNNHSKFRSNLMEILRQPYSDEEYYELFTEVSRPRQKQFDDDTTRSSQAKRSPGKSYLDQHKDFAKKIAEVEIGPDIEHRRPRSLNLLRGFVFFLQNLPVEGAFKPWTDKLCLEALPRGGPEGVPGRPPAQGPKISGPPSGTELARSSGVMSRLKY